MSQRSIDAVVEIHSKPEVMATVMDMMKNGKQPVPPHISPRPSPESTLRGLHHKMGNVHSGFRKLHEPRQRRPQHHRARRVPQVACLVPTGPYCDNQINQWHGVPTASVLPPPTGKCLANGFRASAHASGSGIRTQHHPYMYMCW